VEGVECLDGGADPGAVGVVAFAGGLDQAAGHQVAVEFEHAGPAGGVGDHRPRFPTRVALVAHLAGGLDAGDFACGVPGLGTADADQLLEEVGCGVGAVPRLGGDSLVADDAGDAVGLAGVAAAEDLDLPEADSLAASSVPACTVPVECHRLGLYRLVVLGRADGFPLQCHSVHVHGHQPGGDQFGSLRLLPVLSD
jgi:hypothetical protein